MVDLNKSNVPLADLATFIERVLAAPPLDSSSHARIRAVLHRTDEGMRNVLSVIQIGVPEAPRIERDYQDVVLIDETVPGKSIVDQLRSADAAVVLGGARVLLDGTGHWERHSSNNYFTEDVPCYAIALSPKESNVRVSWGLPLLRHSLPPFEDAVDAVRQWIPLRPFHGSSDARIGRLIVAVPIHGPRFGSAVLEDNRLVVQVVHAKADSGLEIKIICQSAQTVVSRDSLPVTGESATIDVADGVDSIACYLIDSQSAVNDHFTETPYQCSRRNRVLYPAGRSAGNDIELLEQIHRGESETIEFKPYLRLGEGKQEELVRAAIAFANTHGGTIFIGVSDLQEIKGVEKGVFQDDKKATTGEVGQKVALEDYCRRIRKLLADRSIHALSATVSAVTVAGQVIVRVDVPEGKEKPYSDAQSNETWIRRGANSVRPTPEVLKNLLREEQGSELGSLRTGAISRRQRR